MELITCTSLEMHKQVEKIVAKPVNKTHERKKQMQHMILHTMFAGASWKYLYSRGRSCLNRHSNDEGALCKIEKC